MPKESGYNIAGDRFLPIINGDPVKVAQRALGVPPDPHPTTIYDSYQKLVSAFVRFGYLVGKEEMDEEDQRQFSIISASIDMICARLLGTDFVSSYNKEAAEDIVDASTRFFNTILSIKEKVSSMVDDIFNEDDTLKEGAHLPPLDFGDDDKEDDEPTEA